MPVTSRTRITLGLVAAAVGGAALLPSTAHALSCPEELQPCAVLEIHTTTDKDPGYGTEINAFRADDPDRPVATTDVQGSLPDGEMAVTPGKYKLTIDDSWYGGKSFTTAKVITVTSPRTRLTLHVKVPRGVYNHTVDANGAGVPFARTIVYDAHDPTEAVARVDADYLGRSLGLTGQGQRARVIDPTGRFRDRTFDSAESFSDRAPFLNTTPLVKLDRIRPLTRQPFSSSGDSQLSGTITVPHSDYPEDVIFVFLADDDTGPVAWNNIYRLTEQPDDQHKYLIRDIGPGRYKLRFADSQWIGGATFDDATVFDVGQDEKVVADFTLPDHGDIHGRVVSTLGTPLHGQLVTVFDPSSSLPIMYTGTDDDGRFELHGLPIQPVQIRVSDAENRFVRRWYGGDSSRSGAKTVTPVDDDDVTLPDIRVRRGLYALTAPTITGTRTHRHTLKGHSGRWSRWATSYSRRWYRDGKAISGATGATYRLRSADKGHRISFGMTAKRSGFVTATSLSRTTGKIS